MLTSDHVSDETEAERDHPCQVTDDLDHEVEGRDVPDWPQKVLQIVLHAVLAHPKDVGRDEHHQRRSEGCVEVLGGRRHAGEEAENVGEEDVERDRSHQREALPRQILAHSVLGQPEKPVEDHVEEVSGATNGPRGPPWSFWRAGSFWPA